jgi:hypothetical protein
MTRMHAWGIIVDSVDDSPTTGAGISSYIMVIEAMYQFCKLAGITAVTKTNAWRVSEMPLPTDYNYFPNADMATTPKTIIGSLNAPDYPDGWDGGVVITDTVDGGTENVLHINNTGETSLTYFTRQYAIKPGGFSLSLFAVGVGTIKIKKIRNNHAYNTNNGDGFEDWIEIEVNNVIWSEITNNNVIENAPLVSYSDPETPNDEVVQNYYKGYDNKVCGIHIELIIAAGDELKISKPIIIMT